MDEIDNDGAQKPHQDVQDREKGWILQFHWSWGLSSYLISEGNLLNISLGLGILILNPIGEKNPSRFSLVHEGWGGH